MTQGDFDPIGKPYPYLERGTTNRFTVDTRGDVKLEDIRSAALVLGPDPYDKDASKNIRKRYGTVWYPDTVTLEVNGVAVSKLALIGQKFGPGAVIDLAWPGPAANLRSLKAPRLPSRTKVTQLKLPSRDARLPQR